MGERLLRERAQIMDGARMERTLTRMAHEILERRPRLEGVVLVGVRSRGVPLAQRLARTLAKACGVTPPVGALDISLYRDDFTSIAPQPVTKGTEIPFSIDGRTVVLVDDVLFTGRTVRCALDELVDFGRPARIELAVLVDRGHRELPVRADYVGKTVATAREQVVQVLLREQDGRDGVTLLDRQREADATGAAPRRPAGRRAPSRGRGRAAAGGALRKLGGRKR
jgi:pyrimidine operon attenuation protein/uracil phosphoribosyltransferase